MSIKVKDKNRAELVKSIIRQNGGKIFTVVAKRKAPKVSYVNIVVPVEEKGITQSQFNKLSESDKCDYEKRTENFMTLTCRTGVKKDLKGGKSTISHVSDLISVNLTNGEGYRCFSAYNVLSIKCGGAELNFKEADVLAFDGE